MSAIKKLLGEGLKFSSFGIVITLSSILAYYILLEVFFLPLYPVYITVYCIGVTCSYLLNARYTFKQDYNKRESIKYFGAYLIGLLFGLILIELISIFLPQISDFFTTLLSIPPRVVLTFIIIKYVVFK